MKIRINTLVHFFLLIIFQKFKFLCSKIILKVNFPRCLSANFENFFGDPLPVWGNPNLIVNQYSWCISSWVDANYNHSVAPFLLVLTHRKLQNCRSMIPELTTEDTV